MNEMENGRVGRVGRVKSKLIQKNILFYKKK